MKGGMSQKQANGGEPCAVLKEDAGGLKSAVRRCVEDGRPYARRHTVRIRVRARAKEHAQNIGVTALGREVLGCSAVAGAASKRCTGGEERSDTASVPSGSGKVQRGSALWSWFWSVRVGFAGEGTRKVVVITQACAAPEECLRTCTHQE